MTTTNTFDFSFRDGIFDEKQLNIKVEVESDHALTSQENQKITEIFKFLSHEVESQSLINQKQIKALSNTQNSLIETLNKSGIHIGPAIGELLKNVNQEIVKSLSDKDLIRAQELILRAQKIPGFNINEIYIKPKHCINFNKPELLNLLQWSAQYGTVEFLKFLLSQGADAESKGFVDKNALEWLENFVCRPGKLKEDEIHSIEEKIRILVPLSSLSPELIKKLIKRGYSNYCNEDVFFTVLSKIFQKCMNADDFYKVVYESIFDNFGIELSYILALDEEKSVFKTNQEDLYKLWSRCHDENLHKKISSLNSFEIIPAIKHILEKSEDKFTNEKLINQLFDSKNQQELKKALIDSLNEKPKVQDVLYLRFSLGDFFSDHDDASIPLSSISAKANSIHESPFKLLKDAIHDKDHSLIARLLFFQKDPSILKEITALVKESTQEIMKIFILNVPLHKIAGNMEEMKSLYEFFLGKTDSILTETIVNEWLLAELPINNLSKEDPLVHLFLETVDKRFKWSHIFISKKFAERVASIFFQHELYQNDKFPNIKKRNTSFFGERVAYHIVQKALDTEDPLLIKIICNKEQAYRSSASSKLTGKNALMILLEKGEKYKNTRLELKDYNLEDRDKETGKTLLMIAIERGEAQLVNEILMIQGFDLDFRNPIYQVDKKVHQRIQGKFFSIKESVDLSGKSVVDYAMESKNGEIIKRMYFAGQITAFQAAPYLENADSDIKNAIEEVVSPKSWRLFAATHLDHLIRNSDFEGESLESALLMLRSGLEDIKRPDLAIKYEQAARVSHILKNITSEKDLIIFSEKFAVTLASLKVNDSCIIPGGWSSPPPFSGHAMLYEVTREQDGSYSFYVYNSGAGVDLGHPQKVIGGKSYYQLGIKIGALQGDTICNPQFLKSLFDLQCQNNKFINSKVNYTAEDFYHKILPNLISKGKRENISEDLLPFSTPQRSGTCFLSSCLPQLQKELLQKAYKDFRFQEKKKTLEEYSSLLISDLDQDHLLLMKEAVKNFSRTELKQVKTDKKEAIDLINRCKARLKSARVAFKENRKKEEIAIPSAVIRNPLDKALYINLYHTLKLPSLEAKTHPTILESASLDDKVKTLNEWGKKFQERQDLCTDRDRLEFIFAIQREFLPLGINDLKRLPKELFHPLVELTNHMVSCVSIPTAESILTFTTLQIAVFELGCLLNDELKSYAPANNLLNIMKYNGFYVLKTPELERKNQDVIQYLEDPEKMKIFTYFNQKKVEISASTLLEEENFLTENGKAKKETLAKSEEDSYKEKAKHDSQLPPIGIRDFEQAVLISDLGSLGILEEPLLSIKRLSLLSSSLDDKRPATFESLKIVTPDRYSSTKALSVLTNQPEKSAFLEHLIKSSVIQQKGSYKSEIYLPSLQSTSPEIEIVRSTFKGLTNNLNEGKRVVDLFNCTHLPGYRLDFILNTIGEELSRFGDRKNQMFFEAFAFCVDGTVPNEIEQNPLLKSQIRDFLINGFDYFVSCQHEINYDGALFFLRLSKTFSNFFGGEAFLHQKELLDEWIKNDNDPKFQALILSHQCLLVDPKNDLSENDIFSFLAADILQETFGLKDFYKDGAVALEFKAIRAANESRIQQWFQDHGDRTNDILNKMAKLFDPSEPDRNWTLSYPIFVTDENYCFDFSRSIFSSPKGYAAPPPKDLSEFYGEKILKGFRKNDEFSFTHSKLGEFTKVDHRLYIHFKDKASSSPGMCYKEQKREDFSQERYPPLFNQENDLKNLVPYTDRLFNLFGNERTLSCLTSDNEVLFIDALTGQMIYSLSQEGLKKLPENELEGGWERVSQYLPSIATIINPELTHLFKATWEFPSFVMKDGKMLVLEVKENGEVWHDEFGVLQKKQEEGASDEGLHFKHPLTGKQTVLFPDASFKPHNTIYRTSATPNTDKGLFNMFAFEKDETGNFIPKTDEERVYLIGFYLAKNQFEIAFNLHSEWHAPKDLSVGTAKQIARLMEIEEWQGGGAHPDRLPMLIKMLSKFPFGILADHLYSEYLNDSNAYTYDLKKNRINCRKELSPFGPLFGNIYTQDYLLHLLENVTVNKKNKMDKKTTILLMESMIVNFASSKLVDYLSCYLQVKGNVNEKYRIGGDELLPLLEKLEKIGKLTFQLDEALKGYQMIEPLDTHLVPSRRILEESQVDGTHKKAMNASSLTHLKDIQEAIEKYAAGSRDRCDLFGFISSSPHKIYGELISSMLGKESKDEARRRVCSVQRTRGDEKQDVFLLAHVYFTGKDSKDEFAAVDYFFKNPEKLTEFFGIDPLEGIKPTVEASQKEGFKKPVLDRTWTSSLQFKLENLILTPPYSSLQTEIDKMSGRQDMLKADLESLIQSMPKDPKELELAVLRREAKEETPLTIADLVGLFLQSDANTLAERTYLTPEEELKLQNLIPEYLEVSTELNRLKKAISLIHSKTEENSQDVDKELKSICETKRQYALSKDKIPHLVFEYTTGFFLRENQVKILEDLGQDESLCRQLVMGGGKTKVLLPMLALAKADGKTLSTIVVPEALFETNLHDLSQSSFKLFGQRGEAFTWDRQTPMEPKYLEERLVSLKRVINRRGYLITTPGSIQSIYLKYIELLSLQKTEDSPKLQASIDGLAAILEVFRKQGSAIIDEFDTVASTRVETIFAGGEEKKLSISEIASVRALYEKMINQKLVKLEENEQYLLSKEGMDELKEALSKTMDKKALSDIVKEEISQLLPLTLMKKGGENYGPSIERPHDLYCIPYGAAQKPKEGSEFGNPLETLNYSFQYYLAKGITKDNAEFWLNQLIKASHEESANDGVPFSETESSMLVKELTGKTLTAFHKNEITEDGKDGVTRFQEAVNNSASAKLTFVEKVVAPKITYFPLTFTSNAQNLSSLFKVVQALTGTPYNRKTYPDQMITILDESLVVEVREQVVKDVGTKPVALLHGRSVDEIFKSVPKDNDLRAFIDAGAFFEGRTNTEVAAELATYFKEHKNEGSQNEIKGILFFKGDLLSLMDLSGKITPLKGSDVKDIEDLGFSTKNLFTYYDQSHTTGIDITQKKRASALLFIGLLTKERDLWQAACRMRGLKDGQRIVPVMNVAEGRLIKENREVPTFNEVHAHCTKLQEEQNKEDNFRSIIQKMQNVVIQDALERLINGFSDPSERKKLFEDLEKTELFVQKIDGFLSSAEKEKIETIKVLEKMKSTLLDSYESPRKAIVERELYQTLNIARELISQNEMEKEIVSKAIQSKEVQKQVDQTRETEKDTNLMIENIHSTSKDIENNGTPSSFDWSKINSWEDFIQGCKVNTLQESLERAMKALNPSLDFSAPIFSSNLHIAPLLDVPLEGKERSPFTISGETPYYVLRILSADGKPQYLLLSLNDRFQLLDKKLPHMIIFSALSGKPVYDPDHKYSEIANQQEFKEILAEAQYLAGDIGQLVRKKNFEPFKDWYMKGGVKSQETRKKLLPYLLNQEGRNRIGMSKRFHSLLK